MCLLFDSDHIHKEERGPINRIIYDLADLTAKCWGLTAGLPKCLIIRLLEIVSSPRLPSGCWLPSSPGGQPVVKFTIYLH